MSLVSTLAKLAVGVAIAKGVSHVAKGGLSGRQSANPGTGRSYSGDKSAAPGGLGDMMGSILGNKSASGQGSSGGLGGLLEQLAGQSTAKRNTSTARKAPPSGLDDLLGSLTGASRGAAGGSGGGGLGDLLGGLLGGAAAGGAASGGIGGLGGMLNDILAGNAPAQKPNPQQELAAAVMLKAMVQAIKADGKLDEGEKRKLMDSVGQDADPREIAFVNELLTQPVDVEALVADVPRGLEEQVYLMSLMAIDLDSKQEAQYLHSLAQALGLDPQSVNQIHDQAGAQRLYS